MALTRLRRWRLAASGEPGLLRMAQVTLVTMAVVVAGIADASLQQFKTQLRAISQDSAPSVVLAGNIREDLAAMDMHAVNGFLPGAPAGAYSELEDRKGEVVRLLVEAADRVTFGESELAPLRALVSGLADYVGHAQAAATMGYPEGVPEQLKASQLLHSQLLPAGEELDRANFVPLQAAARYVEEHDYALGTNLAGWLLLALLAAPEVVLAVRFRRIFNPALALALVLLVVVLWRVDSGLTSVQASVREGVEDAFASVHAMSKAKALADDANGDESLYLLSAGDPARQAFYEESFRQKITHLFSAPVTTRVRDQFAAGIERGERVPYDGYLADALNNVTFEGEDALVLAAFDALKRYLDVDARIRALERAGQHGQAIALALGDNPGESNYAFDELDRAMGAVARLNQREFDRRLAGAQSRLLADEIALSGALGLVGLLCFIGLRSRIKEFE